MPEAVPFPVAYVLVSADSSPPAPSLTNPDVPTFGSFTTPLIVTVQYVLVVYVLPMLIVGDLPAPILIVPITSVPTDVTSPASILILPLFPEVAPPIPELIVRFPPVAVAPPRPADSDKYPPSPVVVPVPAEIITTAPAAAAVDELPPRIVILPGIVVLKVDIVKLALAVLVVITFDVA